MIDHSKSEIKKKPLILIVDDVAKNLQVLSNVLNGEGYQISFASNGRQALKIVEFRLPDIILLDIMMPEMDGYEVCEKLKSQDNTRSIPIIFITGKIDQEDVIKGFQLGAVDYITKPFNQIELLSRVKTHLELKLSRDTLIDVNHQLYEKQNELQSVIASKDKFFSIISHDLKGPFSGFLGLSEMLVDESGEMDQAEIELIADSMKHSAKRLYNLLENLLDWSRSQMGRMEYRPMNTDIFELVKKNIDLLSTQAQKKSLELTSNLSEFSYIFSDKNMLTTIMRNILSNAIKFTPTGGKIEVSGKAIEDDFYQITIADNGVGMDEDTVAKLFRIEVKYSTNGTDNEIGTGLGLILCKELIEKNGGTITVKSALNVGTEFIITVPIADSSQA